MGGAKFLGRDEGIPHSKELTAFELFWYWFIGGLPILFFLSIFIFPTPNFIVPILLYILGVILLGWKYFKLEMKNEQGKYFR